MPLSIPPNNLRSKPCLHRMNKIQKVNFNSVDEFLDYLPENELTIVEELRTQVFECIPHIKEKLSFNVPFYSIRKNICCIWPASIPWGNVPDHSVVLGFTQGHLLPDPYNALAAGKRKYVRTLTFPIDQPLDIEMIRFYLFDALEIDAGN